MNNKLYIVPTPIGNLEDITLRAIRILKEVDLILAEDTRTSSKLLKHFEISTRTESLHMHNEHKKVTHYAEKINSGISIAYISDAGTPGISDPGYLLIKTCLENHIEVESLPGPTALVIATLIGLLFLHRKSKKGRNKRLEALVGEDRTIVFYESPHRLLKTLTQLSEFFSAEHKVSVSRELTKLHEENFRGNLTEAIKHFTEKQIKGEIVIVFSPRN